jgi:hypothetical protein
MFKKMEFSLEFLSFSCFQWNVIPDPWESRILGCNYPLLHTVDVTMSASTLGPASSSPMRIPGASRKR